MKHFYWALLVLCPYPFSYGQNSDTVFYKLSYNPPQNHVEVTITFNPRLAQGALLVIPQSAPGTYDLANYAAFVMDVEGKIVSNDVMLGTRGVGSYFEFTGVENQIKSISYKVDISGMEKGLTGAFASSKLRDNYLGILGYSVFGFVEGLEANPVKLEINTASDWPIFSTLRPNLVRDLGRSSFVINDYATLVDAQYLLGTDVQLWEAGESSIPFFVAAYAETEVNLPEIGRRGLASLDGLAGYFGFIPMPHYTMCYEFLVPLSPQHQYGFGMEHLNSMTSSSDTSSAITEFDPNARIGYLVHHIGHSWFPLRSYGKGYRPFQWQIAPLIETVWLNEGFIWYISYYHILKNENIIRRFEGIMNSAPRFIREKSLIELSLLSSTQYSKDFRIGMNIFSRGALFAYDLDQHIAGASGGNKSLKDAMFALYEWSSTNSRGYGTEEIKSIIEAKLGLDITAVWNRWHQPVE